MTQVTDDPALPDDHAAMMRTDRTFAGAVALFGLLGVAPLVSAQVIGQSSLAVDPIFNGLAIALIFGIVISTLLTLVVIPLLYYAVNQRRFS